MYCNIAINGSCSSTRVLFPGESTKDLNQQIFLSYSTCMSWQFSYRLYPGFQTQFSSKITYKSERALWKWDVTRPNVPWTLATWICRVFAGEQFQKTLDAPGVKVRAYNNEVLWHDYDVISFEDLFVILGSKNANKIDNTEVAFLLNLIVQKNNDSTLDKGVENFMEKLFIFHVKIGINKSITFLSVRLNGMNWKTNDKIWINVHICT